MAPTPKLPAKVAVEQASTRRQRQAIPSSLWSAARAQSSLALRLAVEEPTRRILTAAEAVAFPACLPPIQVLGQPLSKTKLY